MQTITSRDGSKRRAFCLSCLKEGKDWIGGDLCSHMLAEQEPVAPPSKLEKPEKYNPKKPVRMRYEKKQ